MAEKIFIADKPTLDNVNTNVTEILDYAIKGNDVTTLTFASNEITSGANTIELVNITGKGVLRHASYYNDATNESFGNILEVYVDGNLIFKGLGYQNLITGIFNHEFTISHGTNNNLLPLTVGNNNLRYGTPSSTLPYLKSNNQVNLPFVEGTPSYHITSYGIPFSESLVIKFVAGVSRKANVLAIVDVK